MHKKTTLGLIAGKGELPRLVAAARPCFILGFEGMEPDKVSPHAVKKIAQVADTLAALRGAGVSEIVLAGHMKRPSILSLKPDAEGAKLIKKMGKAIFGGDDALLKALIAYFDEQGFKVLGAEEVVGAELLSPQGCLTQRSPSVEELEAITFGIQAAKELGARDIGQAVVVRGNAVLAREDEAGTDAMLARLGRAEGAILVKASKPNQERRVDLPAIGVHTVEIIANLGFAGVAVEAGKSLMLGRADIIHQANEKGVFVYGA